MTYANIKPQATERNLVATHGLPFVKTEQGLLVDARLLHKKLGSRQEFSYWIKSRIEKYCFTEGDDYLINLSNQKSTGKGGNRRSIDYLLTLDTAKELAMVERNEVGRMIRRYFIHAEKQARGEVVLVPTEKLKETLKDLKPLNINNRTLYPFHKAMLAMGYRGGGTMYYYKKSYAGHFVDFDSLAYVSIELLTQLYYGRKVKATRKANKQMPSVLPPDFSDKTIEGGSHA